VQPNEPKGSFNYPNFISDYSSSSPGPLDPRDTESQFGLKSLDPTTNLPQIFTLPGLPVNILTTPTDKLLTVIAGGSGTFPRMTAICPPDYQLLPVPLLADFRAIVFQALGDFAWVRWTGTLWSVFETGGSTTIIVPGQTFQ
jgi:hypothetical protein